MRRVLLTLLIMAPAASAQDFSARALLAFERYESTASTTSGFRQTYDLRLDRALTDTARFNIFFRGDDFRGSSTGTFNAGSNTRQLQPGAELAIDMPTVSLLARSEYFGTKSRTGDSEFNRTLQRSSGNFSWMPVGLPTLRVLGQHNRTDDSAAKTRLTDDSAMASLSYDWKGLSAVAEEHYSRSHDPGAGYDRRSTYHAGRLAYATSALGGKLNVIADASAHLMHLDEAGLAGGPTSVPSPVIISQALYAIDETPLDSRDHPPVPNPALNDGDFNKPANISLGPDGVSFQNFTVDIGHIDRVDEIRVLVRDAAGNPLRNGGGPVAFDVYTSENGDIWTGIDSQTTFNAPLSLYSVTFNQITGRWVKVVNFGVNAEATSVTELQAFYHTTLQAGQHRRGDQNGYTGNAGLTYQPTQRWLLSYNGLYSSIQQRLAGTPQSRTSDLEHLGSIQYTITKSWGVRAMYLQRNVRNFVQTGDGASGLTTFLDYSPTKQLRVTLEAGDERQTVDGESFTMQTRAIHATAYVLKSLFVTIDAGTHVQKLSGDGSIARQKFLNLAGHVQLYPTLRMQINGTIQQATSQSNDPAVQLLGPTRDNRVSDNVIWRPGRQLQVSVRTGWVSGAQLSGLTQRYHVEWFPFGDGTVSLGGSYDEDIDPTLNRRATRAVFNPRWLVSRSVIFDLNYTSVTTSYQSVSNFQRTLFATLTLSR